MSGIIRLDLNYVNCYLVKGEKGFVLFDTGGSLLMDKQYTNRREELLKRLEANGVNESNLHLIVLTHGDYDHTSSAAFLRERFKAKIAMHKGDLHLVNNPTAEAWRGNMNSKSFFMRLMFKLAEGQIKKAFKINLDRFTSFTPDIFLTDGQSLSSCGIPAKVIHTPGHTDGSVAALFDDGGLICGDTLANNNKPAPAANAKDFSQMERSIGKLKTLPAKKVYPGHGTPFDFKQVK